MNKKVIDLFRKISHMEDEPKKQIIEILDDKEVISLDDDDNNDDDNLMDLVNDEQGSSDILKMEGDDLDNFILECNNLLK